jgi:hypothetical protein
MEHECFSPKKLTTGMPVPVALNRSFRGSGTK